MKKVFFYSMPLLKVLLFVVFIILCLVPFALISQFNLIDEESIHPLLADILSESVIVIAVLGALLMIFRVFKQYHFKNILIVKRNVISAFIKGTFIGFVLISVCAIVTFFTGNVSFSLGNISFLVAFGYFILYILVGVFEEFIFRTFPLIVLAERYPMAVSILVTSVLFGLAHIYNPGFTWLAMLNITLAGILFSVLILIKRNIYWAVGIHFGWNFTQGTILGYKVSGTDEVGLLSATPLGSIYLSGGSFGIESSIICTILLLAIIVFLLIRHNIEPVEEILDSQLLEKKEQHEFN